MSKKKTMDDKYGDCSDHLICEECGACITCGGCKKAHNILINKKPKHKK